MWNTKKELYKISPIIQTEQITPCGAGLSAGGGAGIFFMDIDLGSDIGSVVLNYTALDIPDRFQIYWDGNLEADSKYVGDGLPSNLPGIFNNVPEKIWNGSVFVPNGTTQNITVTPFDIADGSVLEPTSGSGSISFTKTTATPTTMQIVITAPEGNTSWSIITACPV